MPPTELMKILSRADQIKKEFIEFLSNNNIISDNGEKQLYYLNPLPHTLETFLANSNNILLKCYGASSCREDAVLEGRCIEHSSNLTIDNANLYTDNPLCIYRPSSDRLRIVNLTRNREIVILFTRDVSSIHMYSDCSENIASYSTIEGLDFRNIRVAAISSGYTTLSLLFYDPVVIKCPNKRLCVVYTPTRNSILLLLNEPAIGLVRRHYLNQFLVRTSTTLNIETPLIEVLDYTTLSLPISFSGSCTRLAIFNLLHRSTNSIVKSYRRITKLVFNGMTEYSYRHSIVRVGLPPHGVAELELCIGIL